MNKRNLAIILAFTTSNAEATILVHDPSLAVQNQYNEVANLAKYAETAMRSTQTAMNTLNQYEQTVVQVARMGNPAALRALPGIGTVAELVGTGQQMLRQYNQIKAFANPQNLQYNLNSVTGAYGMQQWNPIAPGAYQFPTASYQVSQTVQDQMIDLERQRQTLEAKRDQTLQMIQGATDQSTVQKLTGMMVGINGAISEVGAREQALAQKSQLQRQQLEAAQLVQRQQMTEATAAQFSHGVTTEMDQLNALAPDYNHQQHLP